MGKGVEPRHWTPDAGLGGRRLVNRGLLVVVLLRYLYWLAAVGAIQLRVFNFGVVDKVGLPAGLAVDLQPDFHSLSPPFRAG